MDITTKKFQRFKWPPHGGFFVYKRDTHIVV